MGQPTEDDDPWCTDDPVEPDVIFVQADIDDDEGE